MTEELEVVEPSLPQRLWLKAADRESLFAALIEAGMVEADEGQTEISGQWFAVSVIGTISKPTGETQVIDGETVDVMAAVDGYHANALIFNGRDVPELELISIGEPGNPVRVFA